MSTFICYSISFFFKPNRPNCRVTSSKAIWYISEHTVLLRQQKAAKKKEFTFAGLPWYLKHSNSKDSTFTITHFDWAYYRLKADGKILSFVHGVNVIINLSDNNSLVKMHVSYGMQFPGFWKSNRREGYQLSRTVACRRMLCRFIKSFLSYRKVETEHSTLVWFPVFVM